MIKEIYADIMDIQTMIKDTYTDIMDIQCAKRINGDKTIKIVNGRAYVQYADGMRIYRFIERNGVCEHERQIVATNF